MARFAFFLALINLAIPASAQTATQSVLSTAFSASGLPLLTDGTILKLRTTAPLSSSDARVGQSVEFEVIEEVRVGNIIVIPARSAAYGTVTAAQSKHSATKTGKLEVSIDYVRLANGDKAVLRAVSAATANSGVEASSKVVFNPSAAAGKDITLARGTEILAGIQKAVEIDPRKYGQVGGSIIPVPEAVSSEGRTELAITSDPDGAEIAIDDRLVGLTPLRVIVAPGDHVLTLRYSGYSTWVRSIHATGGKTNVAAALEKGANGEIGYDSNNPLETCTLSKGCPQSSLAAASRAAKARRSQQQNGGTQSADPQQ